MSVFGLKFTAGLIIQLIAVFAMIAIVVVFVLMRLGIL